MKTRNLSLMSDNDERSLRLPPENPDDDQDHASREHVIPVNSIDYYCISRACHNKSCTLLKIFYLVEINNPNDLLLSPIWQRIWMIIVVLDEKAQTVENMLHIAGLRRSNNRPEWLHGHHG
jgi:hypothetical protein